MSSPSPQQHARLLQLHREIPNKLMDIIIEYDEMNSLLQATGRDTTDLQLTIKLALQTTLLLMAATEEAMSDIKEQASDP